MAKVWHTVTTLLTTILMIEKLSGMSINGKKAMLFEIADQENDDVLVFDEEEYIRHAHAMVDANMEGSKTSGYVIKANEKINTKYRTLKRNADFINFLLALPKGMNDAGR